MHLWNVSCKKCSRISKNLGSLCAKKTNKEIKVDLTGHGELVVYAAESRHFLHGIQTSNSCCYMLSSEYITKLQPLPPFPDDNLVKTWK